MKERQYSRNNGWWLPIADKVKKSSNIGCRIYINSIDKNKLTPWHIVIKQQNINDKIREDKGKSPTGQDSQQQ